MTENKELLKMSKSAVWGMEDSLERFKRFIQTSEFNPDDATLSLIERNLNVKFIVLSEQSYTDNDLANVLSCNIKSAVKTPETYIIITVKK
jgi:hypothetical protein